MKTSLVPPTGMTASGAFFGIGSRVADVASPSKDGRAPMDPIAVHGPARIASRRIPGMRADAHPKCPPVGPADVTARRKTHHHPAPPASMPSEMTGCHISSSRKLMKGEVPLQLVIGRCSSLGVSTLFVRSSPELVFINGRDDMPANDARVMPIEPPGRGSRPRVARNPSSRARHGGPDREFHAASMKRQASSSRAEAPLRSAGHAAAWRDPWRRCLPRAGD
jgi:hypothetical protein